MQGVLILSEQLQNSYSLGNYNWLPEKPAKPSNWFFN